MIALLRTSPPTKENRRHGLTQFLIDLQIAGHHDPPDRQPDRTARFQRDLLRRRVRARSAPDRRSRYGLETGDRRTGLSSAAAPTAGSKPSRCCRSWCARAGPEPGERLAEGIGREVAHLATLAPHVGQRRRHAARRQDPGGRGRGRQGSRHQLGAGAAEQGAPAGAADRRLDPRQQRRPLRGSAAPHHPDRAASDDPGRHPRSPARHHRPRPRSPRKRSTGCVRTALPLARTRARRPRSPFRS